METTPEGTIDEAYYFALYLEPLIESLRGLQDTIKSYSDYKKTHPVREEGNPGLQTPHVRMLNERNKDGIALKGRCVSEHFAAFKKVFDETVRADNFEVFRKG